MAFTVKNTLQFPWPVKVWEPHPEKPGKLIEREFIGHFKLIDPEVSRAHDDTRRAIVDEITPETTAEEMKDIQRRVEEHDHATSLELFCGWDGIEDEEKQPITFSPEAFEEIYRMPRVAAAIKRAYREAVSEDKARLGN